MNDNDFDACLRAFGDAAVQQLEAKGVPLVKDSRLQARQARIGDVEIEGPLRAALELRDAQLASHDDDEAPPREASDDGQFCAIGTGRPYSEARLLAELHASGTLWLSIVDGPTSQSVKISRASALELAGFILDAMQPVTGPRNEYAAIVAGEAIEVLHVTPDGEIWKPATVQHADPLQIVAVYADGQRHSVAPRHVRRAAKPA